MNMPYKLYQYHEDFGRCGSLTGRLLLTDEEYQGLLGKTFVAYDVLGKHSEIESELTAENLTLVTDDAVFINRAEELGVDLETGFDPRCYMEDEEIEEDYEDPDLEEEDSDED
jgi:hypothetical protein